MLTKPLMVTVFGCKNIYVITSIVEIESHKRTDAADTSNTMSPQISSLYWKVEIEPMKNNKIDTLA